MVGLGFLPGGEESVASIANNDGSIIYGTSGTTDPGGRSFRWTADTGMVSMASLLARNGVDIGDVNLWQVTGASDDGKVVVGWGYDAGFTTQHGWIASCAAVCQGIVRQDDLNRSLADLASITRTSTTYADASLGSAAEALDNAAETRASRRGPVTMFGYGLYDSDPVLAAQLGFTLDLPHDMVAGAALHFVPGAGLSRRPQGCPDRSQTGTQRDRERRTHLLCCG